MENMVKATNIETGFWNAIINMLIEDQWTVVERYDNFDVGIDYNRVVLEKGNEKIEFTWDNWMEGEIQCAESVMRDIEKRTGRTLISNPARRPTKE